VFIVIRFVGREENSSSSERKKDGLDHGCIFFPGEGHPVADTQIDTTLGHRSSSGIL